MTLCATTVTYNNLTIRNVLTESVDLSTVYDSTGVDPIGIRTQVVFTGELHTSDVEVEDHGRRVNWGQAAGEGLAGGVYDMVRDFLRPRQEFQMTINDEDLFRIFPDAAAACGEASGRRLDETGGGNADQEINHTAPLGTVKRYDIAHGPRTKCQILAVKGAYSAKCRFTVEFTTPMQCESDASDIRDILNMRWTVADNMDPGNGWLTRRVYAGRIRFRSRSTAFNPHVLARNYAFPPLLRGFRRESIDYSEDPGALEMTFQIADQETWANAPAPATSWEGTYTLAFPQFGIACEQELNLTLKADKLISKQYLVTLALHIMEAKMHWEWIRTNAPGTIFLASSMIQENLVENEIRFSCRTISHSADAWAMNLRQFNSGPGGISFELGKKLPPTVTKWTGILNPRDRYYDKEQQVIPEKFSAAASSLLCTLQNPCCIKTLTQDPLFTTFDHTVPQVPGGPAEPVQVTKYETARYSESHDKAAYQFYRMASSLKADTGWRAFPLGTQCGSSTDEATVAFAHLHCPVQVRKVTIHATRINAWPELIKPVHWLDPNTNIKHVLAHYEIEPLPVQLSADGRDAMHEVTATYWYYLDRPYRVESLNKTPVGRLPYVTKQNLNIGVVTADRPDSDGSAIDQQYFLDPADLLAAVQ